MTEPKDGGPAFPTAETHWVEEPGGQYRDVSVDLPGMSLRDYFAGQALVGLVANLGRAVDEPELIYCYDLADGLLEARRDA